MELYVGMDVSLTDPDESHIAIYRGDLVAIEQWLVIRNRGLVMRWQLGNALEQGT